MNINMMLRLKILFAAMMLFMVACVKEASPPDCKKPAKPTVNAAQITINEGDTIHLVASGASSGAQYLWSGPNGFYSTSSHPQVNVATIANGGIYSVKVLVGYCYSDSVSINVTVNGDT